MELENFQPEANSDSSQVCAVQPFIDFLAADLVLSGKP